VGEKPSEASRAMCILNLRLGFVSRFIRRMRSLRHCRVRMILCMDGRLLVAGRIWRLYHATRAGRLFNYPVHLSSLRSAILRNRIPSCG
jgi:hypothetical protein